MSKEYHRRGCGCDKPKDPCGAPYGCKIQLDAMCVVYSGKDLDNINTTRGDRLDDILENIDDSFLKVYERIIELNPKNWLLSDGSINIEFLEGDYVRISVSDEYINGLLQPIINNINNIDGRVTTNTNDIRNLKTKVDGNTTKINNIGDRVTSNTTLINNLGDKVDDIYEKLKKKIKDLSDILEECCRKDADLCDAVVSKITKKLLPPYQPTENDKVVEKDGKQYVFKNFESEKQKYISKGWTKESENDLSICYKGRENLFKDIDYVVFYYDFSDSGEKYKDLDTRTRLLEPRESEYFGFGSELTKPEQLSSYSSYMEWSGDSQEPGQPETVLFKANQDFSFETSAFWYSGSCADCNNGVVKIKAKAYKGGRMYLDGKEFKNSGGIELGEFTFDPVTVTSNGKSPNEGVTDTGTFTYKYETGVLSNSLTPGKPLDDFFRERTECIRAVLNEPSTGLTEKEVEYAVKVNCTGDGQQPSKKEVLDSLPTTPGEHKVRVKLTYPDGSTKEVEVPILILDGDTPPPSPTEKDSDKCTTSSTTINKDYGESITETEVKAAVTVSCTDGDKSVTKEILDSLPSSTDSGRHMVRVKVTYPDGSSDIQNVTIVIADDETEPPVDCERFLRNIEVNLSNRQGYTFKLSDFEEAYSNRCDGVLHTLKVTRLPDKGKLQLNGVDIIVNQKISRSDISSGLFKWIAPDQDAESTVTFMFVVSDSNNSTDFIG